jgi:hypothetical protein
LFNEIFKKCVELIDEKLKAHYINRENSANKNNQKLDMPDCDLSRDLAGLFSDMPLSDVELEVEGKILKAHKAILLGNFFTKFFNAVSYNF